MTRFDQSYCKEKKSFLKKLIHDYQLLLLVIPGFLVILVYYYLPMIGIVIAFEDFKPDDGIFSKFIGLTNFKFFFLSQYASRVIFNTLYLNIIFIFTVLIFSVTIAIILNEIKSRTIVKFVQTSMFLPYFLSWVIVGYFSLAFFNDGYGVLNKFLQSIGISPVSWYNEPKYWPFILVGFNLWKQVGVNTVIYYAAIINIDKGILDAAAVDGADKIKTIFNIIIPSIKHIITIMILLQIGQVFRADFGLFYNVTRNAGALYATTDVLDTFVVRSLRVVGDIGMSSAAALFQSVAGLITVLISNYMVKKINSENALF